MGQEEQAWDEAIGVPGWLRGPGRELEGLWGALFANGSGEPQSPLGLVYPGD